MEVSFRTNELRQCYDRSALATRTWGTAVGRKYISRVKMLSAARDWQEIRELRTLRLHQLHGQNEGKFAITLNDRWRLIVSEGSTRNSLVIEEVSNHYGD